MNKIKYIILLIFTFLVNGCSIYNFSGAGKINAKTFQVNNFQNNSPLIEPGIERIFTQRLQNLIQNQTNLNLTTSNGELVYEGEITSYRLDANAPASGDIASQTRLTIVINVRFVNKNKEKDNFEKTFSFYDDFPGNTVPTSSQISKSLEIIYQRICQDIFNESLAKW